MGVLSSWLHTEFSCLLDCSNKATMSCLFQQGPSVFFQQGPSVFFQQGSSVFFQQGSSVFFQQGVFRFFQQDRFLSSGVRFLVLILTAPRTSEFSFGRLFGERAHMPRQNGAPNAAAEGIQRKTKAPSPLAERSERLRRDTRKHRSSRNAIRRGIFTDSIFIAGEKRGRYFTLLHRVREDLGLAAELDDILAERLATIIWRQARFLKTESVEFTESMEASLRTQFDPSHLDIDVSEQTQGDQQQGVHSSETIQVSYKKQQPLIPPAEILDRLMSYERHLCREFDRVLGQLERLRKLRRTEL